MKTCIWFEFSTESKWRPSGHSPTISHLSRSNTQKKRLGWGKRDYTTWGKGCQERDLINLAMSIWRKNHYRGCNKGKFEVQDLKGEPESSNEAISVCPKGSRLLTSAHFDGQQRCDNKWGLLVIVTSPTSIPGRVSEMETYNVFIVYVNDCQYISR